MLHSLCRFPEPGTRPSEYMRSTPVSLRFRVAGLGELVLRIRGLLSSLDQQARLCLGVLISGSVIASHERKWLYSSGPTTGVEILSP